MFFFKLRGLWIALPAVVLYLLGVRHVVGGQSLFPYASAGFLELLEWLVVSLTLIFAMRRFKRSREHQEALENDMAMARKLQTALIPKDYDMGSVRIAGRIHQCKEVGGDYYYFRPFQNDKVVFCLGDVMGKGIPSSMVTSIIMGFVYEWGKKYTSPAEVLSTLNERLCNLWGDGSFYFTTVFYAVYDETTRVLTYSTGGHHEAILLRGDGRTESLRTEGGIVGAVDCLTWNEKQVTLEPGDRVIVFTDGVTEARDRRDRLFTMERAVKVIKKARKGEIKGMIAKLFDTLSEYTGGDFADDVAVLVMEVKPEQA